MTNKLLVVDPNDQFDVLKGLASEVRISILKLLAQSGPMNVNQVAAELSLPQSTISSNMQVLENVGLVVTDIQKARKGSQKVCRSVFTEILVAFGDQRPEVRDDEIEVSMPLGLYSHFEVTAPCGLCSTEGVIGLLDVPDTFLDPDRMRAGLLWFTRGFVEYQFPNNAKLLNKPVQSLEFSMELSSEVPGTSADWPSDISLSVNGIHVATWTSPGDFGDKRGVFTPDWWKLAGSQYGKLKTWRINGDGTYVDGLRVSDVTLTDLEVDEHRSIRVRIGVREDAEHPGGMNIFGRGFGNYDQDITMRLR
ncbi:ArsR/SmtB family transcription factor [Histidinibacterium aquaticum]|uniref:Helix-turn-helix domain-containing protein n=1 Tax=Histidinibacterium aquaticum TaxID=2613962 RepID=A0A5J5GHV3_9RHOB|nr:helix-turn-helix domain-containing protein [Histidinibacterium aquaticum]KAA9007819.1 helix-turn-helix domain-containing protein [Histidinibacterium aquaticum]